MSGSNHINELFIKPENERFTLKNIHRHSYHTAIRKTHFEFQKAIFSDSVYNKICNLVICVMQNNFIKT